MVAMEVQGGYGLHFISVKGRYLCWREDYVESVAGQMSFFKLGHEEKFRGTGLSLCCLSVSLSESLIMFGTVKGIIAVYEMFSHKFRLKKIGSQQIVQVAIVKGIGYALTIDYRLLIYDLAQLEEIQSLSVRNEEKLHERISRFEFHHQQLCLFGTEARLYEQYVEEAVHHEHRKM